MNSKKQFWLTIALMNLCIVALLGVTLRSKILFSLPGIDFKYVLHAHSHFAFGGWITLALMSLMIYEILPGSLYARKSYQWFLWGILFNAVGMLISFIIQGYAFFSILFSTLFIFVTYAFSYVFIRDILKSKIEKAVSILSISSVICLAVSSVGPFTLAYILATHSHNTLLYRDSIYTYLHLQYNGFFTLAVFALLFNTICKNFTTDQLSRTRKTAALLSLSILPSLFISYLWHYSNIFVTTLSIIGCVSIIAAIAYLLITLRAVSTHFASVPRFIRSIGLLSITAFLLKSLLQTGTVIPSLGKLVYGDRAIIIGYLHLVLLGFISLYIIAHLLYSGILNAASTFTRIAVRVFAGAVIANQTILMVQGFGNMLMVSNSIYAWLLWGISIFLFTGALMITISRILYSANRFKTYTKSLIAQAII